MSIIAKKKVQFSRGGRVCIRTLRCARPGAGKMLRDSERGAFKSILIGQSTVCERARYDSVLHSKEERIQKKERVVAVPYPYRTSKKKTESLNEYGIHTGTR